MSINYRALQDELTEGFILRECLDGNPTTRDMQERAINAYKNDYRFYNRINTIVAGVIRTVRKHEG